MSSVNAEPAPVLLSQEFLLERHTAPLTVSGRLEGGELHLSWQMPGTAPCLLHWGLAGAPGGQWTRPPKTCWPEGTEIFDELAVRSPFTASGESSVLRLTLPFPAVWRSLEFVLYYPGEDKFVKNRRYDFSLLLPRDATPRERPAEALKRWLSLDSDTGEKTGSVIIHRAPGGADARPESAAERRINNYLLDSGHELAVYVRETLEPQKGVEVFMAANAEPPVSLHWGVTDRFYSRWRQPDAACRPDGTEPFDEKAVRTPFAERDGLAFLRLFFADGEDAPEGMAYLLFRPGENQWIKFQNNDLTLPVFMRELDSPFANDAERELASQIIAAEMGKSSWTLMHRYNMANSLLGDAAGDAAQWRIIFVWLRYSAIRQLDWQRHYNTKPRDLAGAQKSLAGHFGMLWKDYPENRAWARRLMQTVGRGGDGGQGQQIRDEILNIMHRHKLKEEHGHFIEEWHQKLHNNTTPDDIEICKAFLAFMRSDGDLGLFYKVLADAGITRERLRGFERPIVTDPQFYGHCKDGLIADMENYLRILEAVHGGAELESAGARAAWRLSGGGQGLYQGLLSRAVCPEQAWDYINLRREIAGRLADCRDTEEILDWVYFDNALADRFRNIYEQAGADADLWTLFNCALHNCLLTEESPELELCRAHWERLAGQYRGAARNELPVVLEALAVLARAGRTVQERTAALAGGLQAPADYLGKSFAVADWSRKIFVEEVIRGSDWFPLAKVIHLLTAALRRQGGLGGWQLISPASVRGKVVCVENLRGVMGTVYPEPTILLTGSAAGDEDAPEGVVGIITRVAPDLVAHLSVRARNLGLLFAACFDDGRWEELRAFAGKTAAARSLSDGAVEFADAPETGETEESAPGAERPDFSGRRPVPFSRWMLAAPDFTREFLGGKSNNLNLLRGKLPEWMHLPAAVALPFGCCEKTLEHPLNENLRKELKILTSKAEDDPMRWLPEAREIVLKLYPVPEFRDEFTAFYGNSGLPPLHWDHAWRAIKRVWASKWNERAFLSRRALGLPHAALQMAVLVQQVVEAEYAYVIHTVNPLTGNADEVFAEVVLGLGETLVGNFPGSALGFVINKKTKEIRYTSFPGKSVGLYGKGVIFRSDSNGEDLSGYAGAGLYDSVLAEPEETRTLDYTGEKLLLDRAFREDMARKICEIAVAVEEICGGAQDIEGAVRADGAYYIVQNRPQVGL